jgi:hypothetical protein
MKQIIMTLAIALSTLSSFAGRETVSSKVLNSFNSEFTGAKEVTWTSGKNYYKASFVYNNQHVYAFYHTDGDLMGLTRYISSLDLPINLQLDLKKEYTNFWISDLFEVSNTDGTSYYITLEDADTKIVLKSSGGNEWTEYSKSTKA